MYPFKKKGLTCFPANSLFQKLWWHIQILDLISITNSRVPFMEDNVNYTDASNEEFQLYEIKFYELPENICNILKTFSDYLLNL